MVFLIFLASFAVLEVVLWRADEAKKARDLQTPTAATPDTPDTAVPSMVALASRVSEAGRGVAPHAEQETPIDTLK